MAKNLEFVAPMRGAKLASPRISWLFTLVLIGSLVIWLIYWASNAYVDVVTSGAGKVIPSKEVQRVQNLEGGIVSRIDISDGSTVAAGDVLMIIDDTQFQAKFREDQVKLNGFLAAAARLTGELTGEAPVFPEQVQRDAPLLVNRELSLMRARSEEQNAITSVLREQRDQKRQEIVELKSRTATLREALRLGQQELDIIAPLVTKGVTSRVELIRVQREVNDVSGELTQARKALPRAQAALQEIERKIEQQEKVFLSEARTELNEIELNISALRENLIGTQDRLKRTEVVSPVAGVVKQVFVSTIGGVVQPGMDLVEIVPSDDTLLVEARINPADIAFLRPNLPSKVKLSAYDFTVYGSLEGNVEHISADTIIDEEGNSFYEIRIRTNQGYFGDQENPLPIIPGMTAQVDVLTGKRSILDFFLKPIERAAQSAFSIR